MLGLPVNEEARIGDVAVEGGNIACSAAAEAPRVMASPIAANSEISISIVLDELRFVRMGLTGIWVRIS